MGLSNASVTILPSDICSPGRATRIFFAKGINFSIGSLRLNLPSSINMRVAIAVIGFVMDAILNRVSVFIATRLSISAMPLAVA